MVVWLRVLAGLSIIGGLVGLVHGLELWSDAERLYGIYGTEREALRRAIQATSNAWIIGSVVSSAVSATLLWAIADILDAVGKTLKAVQPGAGAVVEMAAPSTDAQLVAREGERELFQRRVVLHDGGETQVWIGKVLGKKECLFLDESEALLWLWGASS